MKQDLTIDALLQEAAAFAAIESGYAEPSMYGVTDGKAVGTYVEQKFRAHLETNYNCGDSNSAKGIDLPIINVDLKVTSIKQPQSSCPFKSGRQKIFGLGYSLLVFVYDKKDDEKTHAAILNILHTIFVIKERTADYQMTTGLRKILENSGNEEDLIAFMHDKMLPIDEIEATKIAKDLMANPPEIGYLTISNALQWRLQYARVIDKAGQINGVVKVR